MPSESAPGPDLDTPGLVGGPGPVPPGVDDGTPKANTGEGEEPAPAEAQRREGEHAERTAGTRAAEVGERDSGERQEREDPEE